MKLIQSPSTVRTGIHELEEEDTRLPPKKNVQGRLHFSSPYGTGSPGEITTKTGDQLLGLRQADSLAPAGELETPRTTNAIINDSLSVALEVEPRPTSQLCVTLERPFTFGKSENDSSSRVLKQLATKPQFSWLKLSGLQKLVVASKGSEKLTLEIFVMVLVFIATRTAVVNLPLNFYN
jgi:hypothetical protein